MALVNRATNEVTVKLVYYGPGLCGKTTNLEKIYGNPKLANKGKMISMATETDRTLFFDFMPMELGEIGGKKVRVQLYTVPGQVFYDATRKLVLRGADGVVFVADSQASMKESNIESLENLYTNLRLNRLDPGKVALVFQCNKRDLPNIASVEEMTTYLKPRSGVQVVEASAINGQGVTATMRAAVAGILHNLKNNIDISLSEQATAEARAVDEQARQVAADMESEPAAAEPEAVVVEPMTAEPAANEMPFGTVTSEDLGIIEESPFDETRPARKSIPREAAVESPFAGSTAAVDGSNDDQVVMEASLVRTQELIRTLESALEIARKQEEELSLRLRK